MVHLAADTRVMDSIEDPTHNFDNNVVGTFNLLNACRELGVSRVVAASTGGAILGEVEPPVHEEMAPMPTSPYGASKLMLEGYLSAYASSYGMRSCALRFSNIYGPRSFHKGSVVAHFFKRVLAGERPTVYGDGSQTRDYLYVGDLVEAIRVAMLSDVTGPYQLGSGHGTTLNELLEAMRTVTGLPIEVDYARLPGGRGPRHLVPGRQGAGRLRLRPLHPAAGGAAAHVGLVPRAVTRRPPGKSPLLPRVERYLLGWSACGDDRSTGH